MELLIQRTTNLATSTSGTLAIDGQHFCFTIEPPVLAPPAKPRAIPAGSYPVTPYNSPHWQRVVPMLEDVPEFEDIEIHIGNFPKDTHGCTCIGFSQDALGNVLHSDAAFEALMPQLARAWQAGELVTAKYIDAGATQ